MVERTITEPRLQVRALFVGNSFTLRHDPPGLAARMSTQSAAGPLLAVTTLAREGASLLNHLEDGGLERMLKQQRFDFVVLQDQSTAPLNRPASFFDAARRCDVMIRSAGARTVLFSTWLGRGQRDWEAVFSAYDKLGTDLSASVAQVGRAWRAAAERGLDLYDPDGEHAGPLGAHLTACVFHRHLLGTDPIDGSAKDRELITHSLPTRRPSCSVIIPCSRPASLQRCLESLCRVDGGGPEEILLVINGVSAACAEVCTRFASRLPALKVLHSVSCTPGAARNLAVRAAKGDWLCFLDDDVRVPPEYFRVLLEKISSHPRAAAIGGPNLTPPDATLFERSSGHLLGSWLGAGRHARRYSGYEYDAWCDDRSLILCNLCIRREILENERLAFDEGLLRNEENLLLELLLRRGQQALHSPALYVHHERRSGLAAFNIQCFLSGEGRGKMTWRLPSSLRLIHLLPPLLLACLLFSPLFPRSLGLITAAYAATALLNALALSVKHSEPARAVLWLWLLHPAAHLSYAAGLIAGLATGPRRRAP